MAKQKIVIGEELWRLVDDEPPPPPPPPPAFPESSGSKSVCFGIAGAVVGLITGIALSFIFSSEGMNGVAEMSLVGWIALGLVDGIVFGWVASFIHNMMLRRSKGMVSFKKIYTTAQDLPDEYVWVYWINNRFEHFFRYLNANFQKKQ
jgi:hypothetical protein